MSSGIYLGGNGSVQLKRTTVNTPLIGILDAADVAVASKRFSFDFDHGALATGDYITIRTEDNSILELISGHSFPDWEGYVHVDDAGGVRLYKNFSDSLDGEKDKALVLVAPTVTKTILVTSAGRSFRYLADVTSYQLTTSREAVDLTSLGEEHRRSYASGLISGQGVLSCLWDYKHEVCDEKSGMELSHYMAQLILRVRQGASFHGRFYLLDRDPEFVWYDADLCVITNVGIAVTSTDVIRAEIEFLVSGPIRLRMGEPPGYVLAGDDQFLLQESGERVELEDP